MLQTGDKHQEPDVLLRLKYEETDEISLEGELPVPFMTETEKQHGDKTKLLDQD